MLIQGRDYLFIKLTMPVEAKPPDKSLPPPRDLLGLLGELDRRDTLITWICMLGGLRPNELFALFVRNVGLDRLYVENALDRKRKFRKTKTKKPREVLLPPILCSACSLGITDSRGARGLVATTA